MPISEENYEKILKLVPKMSDDQVEGLTRLAINIRQLRYRQSSALKAAEFKTGDRVQFVNCKPKYLDGTRGVILGRAGVGKFRVELDLNCDPRAKRRYGSRPVAPAGILEKIPSGTHASRELVDPSTLTKITRIQ